MVSHDPRDAASPFSEEQRELLQALSEQVSQFPKLPGVYLMSDAEGVVIYVGKAKELRARVKSYFMGGDGRSQIGFLLQRVRKIEKIVTGSEHQALVLERDLITQYKPRYNIRLKDDKAFLSIRVDENAPWPRLELVRKRPDDGARYFGPYSYSYELRTLLDIIKRVVPLRTCTDTVFFNRQRPCLEYQIKRCAGPCTLPVDREEYRGWIKQAIAILEGRTEKLCSDLTVLMERASDDLRFEDAATLRDRLEVLKNFKEGTSLVSSRGEDRDVFALYREERLVSLAVIQVRSGRIAHGAHYTFQEVSISDEELLESALMQYYEHGREVPEEIVVPCELENHSMLSEALAARRGGKAVAIAVPQRGLKARLLDIAQVNAREHFVATFAAEDRYRELARALAVTLQLRQAPRRIECVDISNLQGSDIVGAIVSFIDGEPDKQNYRRYRIKGMSKPDDFASIQEVVGRRLERGKAEGTLPDLLVVDGGPGQLAMAIEARDMLGVELEIVSIAKMRTEKGFTKQEISKKPERIYREGQEEPIFLDEGSEVTQFLQRVRDEVHRFVITFHRATRAKRVFRSALDEIAGVGPERRGRLMREFGSVAQLAKASAEEIATKGRMPLALAEKIVRSLATNKQTEE